VDQQLKKVALFAVVEISSTPSQLIQAKPLPATKSKEERRQIFMPGCVR
jgi:hypothetical protein